MSDLLLRYRCHGGQVSGARYRLRLLEVLAAQHAARLRRAGRPDPMAAYARIDARTLRGIGVPRAAIDAALGEREVTALPLGWSGMAGLLRAAREQVMDRKDAET